MKLETDALIPFPRDQVWRVYRDELPALVRFLPNVRRIEVRSRVDKGDLVELVNEWHGGGEIPKVARAFLSESLLSWTDFATWRAPDWSCHWRMETHAFKDVVRAQGINRYVDLGDSTRLEIRGDITIDPSGLTMVPRFLAPRAAHGVEQFIVSRVQPNLLEIAQGVASFLREAGRHSPP